MGFPQWLSGKESAYNVRAAGNMGSIPVLGRSPRGGCGNTLQYSCLEEQGYSPWGCKGSDTTEMIYMPQHFFPCSGPNTQYTLTMLVELDLELTKGDNCL